jgi:hypothetical protein
MAGHSSNLLEVAWDRFDPGRIPSVRKQLAPHPARHLPALIELGKRLEARGRVRSHSGDATAGTAFNDAPRLHPNAKGVEATLADIEHAAAWTSLLNVQSDPQYRAVVDEVLDSIRPQVEAVDPGMCYRAGWIFLTSPRAVTPFHMDKEHNFILQLRGSKRIYVWDHRDTTVVSEHARDRFHRTHSRELLQWREEYRERAQVFELEPGMGAYMPSTSPHMVENGDGPSITMSFSYYTRSTRRNSLLHRTHDMMRSAGWVPPAVGRSPLFDAATLAAGGFYAGAKRLGRRLAGASLDSDAAPYARVGGS